jgi:hypothetical protein
MAQGDAPKTTAEKSRKSKAAKVAGLAATILWVLGFLLTCILPPRSTFVWTGDALLLIGFWPLLWIWRPGWPWLVFGVLNLAIGCILEISYYIDASTFTKEMIVVRDHLRDSHSALTWMFIGIISAVVGIVRMIRHLFQFIANKSKK